MASETDPFAPLTAELDRWTDLGRTATIWWRDDDAVAETPALGRLRAMTAAAGVPVALAVIPARADPSLAATLADWPGVAVLQHGWSHADHAAPGAKRCELAEGRRPADVLAELRRGQEALARAFAPWFLPVLVPPWNRIAPTIVAALPDAGYAGLSTFGPRMSQAPAAGVVAANAHVDIMQWRPRAGLDPVVTAEAMVAHLGARRTGRADPMEPTGVLTHHLVHDDTAWATCSGLLDVLTRHPAVRWIGATAVFGEQG